MSDNINVDYGHDFNGRSADCAFHTHEYCTYDNCKCYCHEDGVK